MTAPPVTAETGLARRFLAFSAEVTGFTEFDLHGTGQAMSYLDTVVRVVGDDLLAQLLDSYDRTAGRTDPTKADSARTDRQARAAALTTEIFSDEKLGPIARNIIKLWYAGVWYELPPDWIENFGALENDGTFTASPAAYPEGLLWRAIGANPPGAHGPGYGSWAQPPRIPPIPGDETQ